MFVITVTAAGGSSPVDRRAGTGAPEGLPSTRAGACGTMRSTKPGGSSRA